MLSGKATVSRFSLLFAGSDWNERQESTQTKKNAPSTCIHGDLFFVINIYGKLVIA